MDQVGQVIPAGEVPPEIKLVNEFLNTLDLERFGEHADTPETERDELRTAEGLRRWLVARDLLPADAAISEDDRHAAIAVRTVLRAAAEANGRGGQTLGAGALEQADLNQFPLIVRLDSTGQPTLSALTSGDVQGALGCLLADVATAVAKGTWSRLKICGAPDCRWAYYDHSKSRTGRWCSMRTCGNRHKTRRYRRRHRAGQ